MAKVLKASARTSNLKLDLDLPSKEILSVKSSISILYKLESAQFKNIITQYGLEYESIITAVFRSSASDICAQFFAKDMHSGKRADIEKAVLAEMKENFLVLLVFITQLMLKALKKIFSPKVMEQFTEVKPIIRSDIFLHQLKSRKSDIVSTIGYLNSEWNRGKTSEEHISTYIIDRKDSAGIVTKVQGCNCIDHYQLVQEYVKNTMISEMSYMLHVNRHIYESENGTARQRWIYFLKPRPSFDSNGKYNQKFGNIMMEVKMDLEDSFHFKFQITYYTGHNYTTPLSLDSLFEHLLA